jgi:hypothetical protein
MVLWVPTIADPENPTATELNAGSVVDMSCYLTGEGWQSSTDEQTVTDERLCSTATYEQPGRYSDTLTVGYVHNPTSPSNNIAYTTLPRGTVGNLVTRWGVPFDQVRAAGDIVDVYPVTAGIQQKVAPTANSVLSATQKMFIKAPGVQRDVVVA